MRTAATLKKIAILALPVALTFGCASQEALKKMEGDIATAQGTANEAKAMAADAKQMAMEAKEDAARANERIDRAFRKGVRK